MKALKIKIRDAGLFRDPRVSRSQDKMMDSTGYASRFDRRSRKSTPYIEVPAGNLSIKQVANLLRVLWGERPVPSLRKVSEYFKADPYFERLAEKTLVEMESPVLPADKVHRGKDYYPEETTTVRKSIGDSWQTATISYLLDGKHVQVKGGLLYPARLRRYLGDTLYQRFAALVKGYGGANTVKNGIELLNQHKSDPGVVEFCAQCKADGRTSISNIILNANPGSVTLHTFSPKFPLNLLMACGTVDTISKFSATLYVPVTGEDLAKVDSGTGVATFLEGGLVTVVGVEDWSELLELDKVKSVEGTYVSD